MLNTFKSTKVQQTTYINKPGEL